MAIKWLCTGKSEHGYQYKDAEGTLQNSSVIAVDFKAEIDTESEAGSVNELYETKPVLTEAGVEDFVGLQVYPQGFTVYADYRLSNTESGSDVEMGETAIAVSTLLNTAVGSYLNVGVNNV